jgi:hypothetical protein
MSIQHIFKKICKQVNPLETTIKLVPTQNGTTDMKLIITENEESILIILELREKIFQFVCSYQENENRLYGLTHNSEYRIIVPLADIEKPFVWFVVGKKNGKDYTNCLSGKMSLSK